MALALTLAAAGLRALSSPSANAGASPSPEPSRDSPRSLRDTPFFLTLSAPADEVLLESAGHTVTPSPDSLQLSGTLPLEGEHPTIFVTVRWADDREIPRFAKLVLEPAGLPTLTHTFDADGDLLDVWEPHLHE